MRFLLLIPALGLLGCPKQTPPADPVALPPTLDRALASLHYTPPPVSTGLFQPGMIVNVAHGGSLWGKDCLAKPEPIWGPVTDFSVSHDLQAGVDIGGTLLSKLIDISSTTEAHYLVSFKHMELGQVEERQLSHLTRECLTDLRDALQARSDLRWVQGVLRAQIDRLTSFSTHNDVKFGVKQVQVGANAGYDGKSTQSSGESQVAIGFLLLPVMDVDAVTRQLLDEKLITPEGLQDLRAAPATPPTSWEDRPAVVPPVVQDDRSSTERLEDTCKAGDLNACVRVGNRFYSGDQVAQNLTVAAGWYDRACRAGRSEVCSILYKMFSEGAATVPANAQRATEYARIDCENGTLAACATTGAAYFHGRGVPQDYGVAAQYWSDACEGGNATGCNNLGSLYFDGNGVREDRTYARELFARACDGGNPMGCTSLRDNY